MTPSFWWIVPAAGIGARMGADLPKQYLELAGKPVLAHTLERLLAVPGWRGLVLALSEDDRWWEGLPQAAHPGVIRCCGGRERGDSVLNALRVLDGRAKERDWVLVHDAARPCLRVRDVQRLLAALADDPVGGLLATPVRDTMKRADAEGRVAATVPREALWHALTPQMFRYGVLREALESAAQAGAGVTDEASAIERLGGRPRLIEGHDDNIKVTRPGDLWLARVFLQAQSEEGA